MQLEKAIKTRRSVRNFSNKKVDWRKIIQSLDYARYSPVAGNQYNMKYVFVSKKDKIQAIEGACQQKFVGKVDYILVVVANRKRVKDYYDKNNKEFAAQQAGAAIQNILLGLNEKGLSTCWVGFFEESIIKRVLGISDSLSVEAILPIGYESKVSKEKAKVKPDLSTILFFEEWGNKYMGKDTRVNSNSS